MSTQLAKAFILSVLVGCAGDDTADSATEGCPAGDLGCPCIVELADLCWDGATCVSDVCVDLTELTTTGDESTSSTGSEPECYLTEVCAADELCYDDVCAPARDLYYTFTINHFAPDSCRDGVGAAEPYFKYYLDGELDTISPEGKCNAGWDLDMTYEGGLDFQVDFYEADAIFDDFYGTFCWGEECGEVPPEVLRSGLFSGTFGTMDHWIQVTFEPAGWL